MMNEEMSSDPLARLGRAAAGLRFADLPKEVMFRAKQRLLDTVACLVAGYRASFADVIRSYAIAQGGTPEATLLPGGERTSAALAALTHATCIHGLELSDAAPRGTVHPGNEIVPAALALAERKGTDGAGILAAVVAGYEVEIRVGRSVYPDAFHRGWWTPGMLGAVGPATTAAHILGLDGAGHADALGVVANIAPTCLVHAHEEGCSAKWLMGGQACAAGMFAAEMAARGTKGMRNVVDGWLPVISDKTYPERLTEGVIDGRFADWELLRGILTKHYAFVGPLTAPIDATFDLVAEHGVRASDVTEIVVECNTRTAFFSVRRPETEVAAKASLPYCLAFALHHNDRDALLGGAFQPARLRDPVVGALSDKVRIVINDRYESLYPARSVVHVTIRLTNGATFSRERDRDEDGRYLTPTDADIMGKFQRIGGPILGDAQTARALELWQDFERLATIDTFIAALRPEA